MTKKVLQKLAQTMRRKENATLSQPFVFLIIPTAVHQNPPTVQRKEKVIPFFSLPTSCANDDGTLQSKSYPRALSGEPSPMNFFINSSSFSNP